MENEKSIFVLYAPSAIHMGMLLLGLGKTRELAKLSAYGRKRSVMRGHILRAMPLADAIATWGEGSVYAEL